MYVLERLLTFFYGAFRADALGHIVYAIHEETVRESHLRDGQILKAESAVAYFAVEMHVSVIIGLTFGVTEFIADALATVINPVEQMVLIEKSQSTENSGLVNRVNTLLQLRHGDWALTPGQRLEHQHPVGRRFYPVLLQYLF